MRDTEFLQKTADELGPSISAMARRLLDNPRQDAMDQNLDLVCPL